MHYPPNNYKELVRLLKRLGFYQVHSGKHSFKFKHSTRRPRDLTKRDFIVISTGKGENYSKVVLKELIRDFKFSEKSIKDVC